MRPKGMEDLAACNARGKESSSRGKRRVLLCRRTVRVKVEGKLIPASFLKIEGDAGWGERPEREGRIEELVGGQSPGPEAPPRSKRGGSKGDIRTQERSDGEGWVCRGHLG